MTECLFSDHKPRFSYAPAISVGVEEEAKEVELKGDRSGERWTRADLEALATCVDFMTLVEEYLGKRRLYNITPDDGRKMYIAARKHGIWTGVPAFSGEIHFDLQRQRIRYVNVWYAKRDDLLPSITVWECKEDKDLYVAVVI